MDVLFVASVAPIVRDADASRSFYRDALGLSFEGEEGDYMFTQKLEGTKHFGLWPLSEAANACFGTTAWPSDVPVPQASIEFEVPDRCRGSRRAHGQGLPAHPRDSHGAVVPDHRPTAEPRRIARCRLLHPIVPRHT